MSVVVVGGGIAGASVAYHLSALTDPDVTLLERGEPASETTAKSGAFVGFWGHESERTVPLLRYGIQFYRDLLADDRTDAAYVHGGRLRVATTDDGDQALRETFTADLGVEAEDGVATAGTPTETGAPVQYVPGDALASTLVLPGVATDAVTGAIYSPGVGFVDDPGALARALLDRAKNAGATVEPSTGVAEILTSNGRVAGVRADSRRVSADAVVCTAGPWNRELLAAANVTLPVRNTRGPLLTVDEPASHALPALFHEETGVYTRPNRDGTWSVGHYPGEYGDAETLTPDDVPNGVPAEQRAGHLDAASRFVPGLADATVRTESVGVRTLTPDGDPIVGETAVAGLAVVAFNANGIQYAPAAGRILASRLGGVERAFDAGVLSPQRFG